MMHSVHSHQTNPQPLIDKGPIQRSRALDVGLRAFGEIFMDPDITEIAVNYPGVVFYEKKSVWHGIENKDITIDWCKSFSTAAATYNKDEISDVKPFLSCVLPGNERAQIVMPPACSDGTYSITIRKPSQMTLRLSDYAKQGFFNKIRPISNELTMEDQVLLELHRKQRIEDFLYKAIQYGKTIVIAGSTGSGKTTFMKALIEELARELRIITIEDTHEMFLDNHPNSVHLFYKKPGPDGKTISSPSDCLHSCLRMKPDRILLTELRGGETLDFIDVSSSGHSGSITSVHAGNCNIAWSVLASKAAQNPRAATLGKEIIKEMLYQTIDVLIHVNNETGGAGAGRYISEIWFDPTKKLAA